MITRTLPPSRVQDTWLPAGGRHPFFPWSKISKDTYECLDRARSRHILVTVLLLLGRDRIGVPVPSSSATAGVRYRTRGEERRDKRFELKLSAAERTVLASIFHPAEASA